MDLSALNKSLTRLVFLANVVLDCGGAIGFKNPPSPLFKGGVALFPLVKGVRGI